ncbi:MAG: ExbD/TolR family protein [Elusimicrobiota bacterium]
MKVGQSQGTGKYHIQAEINMVPLIDIALVLLIIFMVISPMLVDSQLKVNLPKVTTATSSDEQALKVEIDASGRLGFEGKNISFSDLKQVLYKKLPPGHKASLLIQADQNVSFNSVVGVMDLAKQLKVEKLGVAVSPESINQ